MKTLPFPPAPPRHARRRSDRVKRRTTPSGFWGAAAQRSGRFMDNPSGRAARWLLAAGLALAAIHPGQAPAQPAGPGGLSLDLPEGPHPHPGEVLPFFTMRGVQRDCARVEYDLRFGARGHPASFLDPAFIAYLEALRLDFSDQLPPGLKVVGIKVSGDGTDAAGGPLSAGTIASTAAADDTAELVDFRLSAADLDGIGAWNERYVDIRITAAIDHAAFPAATAVAPAMPAQGQPTVPAASVEVSRKAPAAPLAPAVEGRTPGMQELVVIAKPGEICWVEVSEGQRRKTFTIRDGDSRRFEFSKTAKVRLGNAGGVNFRLNGSPYSYEGQRGQTAALEIAPQ